MRVNDLRVEVLFDCRASCTVTVTYTTLILTSRRLNAPVTAYHLHTHTHLHHYISTSLA